MNRLFLTQYKNLQYKLLIKNSLINKTFIISCGTGKIGYEIGKKLVIEGSRVALLGKDVDSDAKKICFLSSTKNCIGIECDIRIPNQIDMAVTRVKKTFGKFDGVVIHANSVALNTTCEQKIDDINLMTDRNIKGSFLLGQKCLKDLSVMDKSHILILAPPLRIIDIDEYWIPNFYYSMSKYNMSLMAKFWNKEFPNVAVNTLWPRISMDSKVGPHNNHLAPKILAEAAKFILSSEGEFCNGKNFIDDELYTSVINDKNL